MTTERNDGFDYRGRVPAEAGGMTLLDHLAAGYPHSTRAQWHERIDEGRVLVDDRPGRADERLRAGSVVVWRRPPWIEPEAPRSVAVLYRDDEVLAIAKPAGLPTLAGAGYLRHTVAAIVERIAPGAAPIHRLGRWTSGVVVCGLTPRARAALAEDLAARRVLKRYRALASGSPAVDRLEIDRPIGPVPHRVLGTVHGADPDGRPAQSIVTVVERRDDGFLCDVEITTGRPHQIRIHLAAAGHPLVGDPLYVAGGRPAADTTALPGDPGYRLHAAEIALAHPADRRELRVVCAPPRDLARRP